MDWHQRYSQQARWTEDIRAFLFRRIGLIDGDRLLEVGCGTGAVLESIPPILRRLNIRADQSTDPRLFGLDIDPVALEQAGRHVPSANLTLADAREIPFPDWTFDLTYCHFLLLWVKPAEQALQELQRVTRPGGWVAAFAEPDYGGRIDYPEQLVELGSCQEENLRRQGAETRMGRQLKALFHKTELVNIECGIIGAQWGTRPPRQELELEWQAIVDDLQGSLEPASLERLHQTEQDAWETSARTLFVPTFYAFGQVPERH